MSQVLLEDYINNLFSQLEQEEEINIPQGEAPEQNIAPKKQPISREQLLAILKGKRGKMLTVAYRKKDGSLRIINTVTGVRKNITGAGLKYDPEKYGYVILYDLKAKGYRTVNMNTVGDVKMDKQVFTVTEGLSTFPIKFKLGTVNLEGEAAWNHWKKWMNINRVDKYVSDVLDTIKRQNYQCTSKQYQVLVRWFNSSR
jgi:hypothetical protein